MQCPNSFGAAFLSLGGSLKGGIPLTKMALQINPKLTKLIWVDRTSTGLIHASLSLDLAWDGVQLSGSAIILHGTWLAVL